MSRYVKITDLEPTAVAQSHSGKFWGVCFPYAHSCVGFWREIDLGTLKRDMDNYGWRTDNKGQSRLYRLPTF